MTEYPKYFEECPLCHCRNRILEEEVNEEKKAGRILEQRIPCSTQKLIPVRDPAKTTLVFPVLLIHFDYCARCGYEYPHVITRDKMTWDQFQSLYMQLMGMTTVGKG